MIRSVISEKLYDFIDKTIHSEEDFDLKTII